MESLQTRGDELSERTRPAYAREPAAQVKQVAKAGTAATAALTALTLPAVALGLLRLNFGKMLGTALATDSRRTQALGWGIHALNGLLLAGAYKAAFRTLGTQPTATHGALLGVGHAGVALAGLALLPRLHPRPFTAGLQPFSAAAYGPLTVPGMLAGHVVYGAVVGAMLATDRDQPSAAE